MTFHKLTLATALMSSTALAAHAGNVADYDGGNVVSGDMTIESSAETGTTTSTSTGSATEIVKDYDGGNVVSGDFEADTATDTSVDVNAKTVSSLTVDEELSAAMIVDDDVATKGEFAAMSNPDEILAAAEIGSDVWSADGEVIGKVVAVNDYETHGKLVIVDVVHEALIPTEMLGLAFKSLDLNAAGDLKYAADLDNLREAVVESM